MKDNKPIPFPGGAPDLPPMTAAERKIWAASHNLPADMLLVAVPEMLAMKQSFDAALREVQEWRRIGRMYLGADLPESAEPALRGVLAAKEKLEKEAKEKAKIPATIRPVEQ